MEENIPGSPFTRTEAKRRVNLLQNVVKLLKGIEEENEKDSREDLKGNTR